MKTIKELYKDLYFNHKQWNYYFKKIEMPDSPESFEEFCIKYIELSGKLQNNPLTDVLNHNRSNEHVFSVFFLGILVYNNCSAVKTTIDKKLSYYKKQNPKADISFPYVWFMIALFHDSGYTFEKEDRIRSIQSFKDEYRIEFPLKSSVGVPRFMSKVYENYFNYRFHPTLDDDIRKPDHGILAGLLLYDSLTNIFEVNKPDDYDENKGYYMNELFWSKNLLNIYNLCSWVILSHNIFYARKGVVDDETLKLYESKEYELHPLILDASQESAINLKQYPFLFLLCLVDTIEPYKMGKDNSWTEIEKNYKINFTKNSVDLELPDSIPNSIKQMENWLAVDVKSNSLNQATITFK
ncbi:MAG: hypothetical protein RBR97_13835 [Bacteroidales bacterium]|nr:hypothetical protein [Bacteroidales bacterium]